MKGRRPADDSTHEEPDAGCVTQLAARFTASKILQKPLHCFGFGALHTEIKLNTCSTWAVQVNSDLAFMISAWRPCDVVDSRTNSGIYLRLL